MEIIQEGDNWRVYLVPDEDMYDDSYIDTWDESDERKAQLKRELWGRIEHEGVWGLVGEVKCSTCGTWEHTDSVWGFVGMDWKDSGYLESVLEQTKAKAEPWKDDLTQFARLLCGIVATRPLLAWLEEGMNLPSSEVNELFDRANTVWEAAKRRHVKEGPTRCACGDDSCCASTGICGSLTFGKGKLDDWGYWAEPCSPCARQWEEDNPGTSAWPFKE